MESGARGGLDSFFEPGSIAVAGASTDPNKLGSIIFANLLANRRSGILKARVYALNPAHGAIGSEPCYPSVEALPEAPELLIVAVPAPLTLGMVESAGAAGVKAVILIPGGYAEVGNKLEEGEIAQTARKHGMRVLGPNTIGLVDTRSGVDSLFLRPTKTLPGGGEVVSHVKPLVGGVVVVTQSGFLGEAVASELATRGVGVRAIVGTGNQVDVSVDDVMEHFARDRHTEVIVVYVEGLRDGRRFMRAAASAKPVVVFKVGKTERGARAALTHTSSMVGDYDVYRAAFRQAGAVEAGSLQELVDFAIAFQILPKVTGRRLVILTNAGGVGAVAADEAVGLGLRVEALTQTSEIGLRGEFRGSAFMANSSLANPIDLTASVSSDDFARVTEYALGLREYDAAVLLPTHQAPGMLFDAGERLADVAAKSGKPVSVCVIGEDEMARRIRGQLLARGIPSYPTPERAVRALAAVSRYAELARRSKASRLAKEVRWPGPVKNRAPMEHGQVSRLLRRYGIAEPKSAVVGGGRDVVLRGVRFPVACKLIAREAVHKTDIGGVVLNVGSAAGAREARSKLSRLARRRGLEYGGMLVQEMVRGVELLLGATRDPTFGPVVTLGMGGTYAEVMKEYRLAIAPVSVGVARGMLTGTKMGTILEGYRGGPMVSVEKLCRTISSFSKILAENPEIVEAEINPLVASEQGVFAVDARATTSDGSREDRRGGRRRA